MTKFKCIRVFFVVNFLLLKKAKSRDSGQFCPIIPGYRKASKILNPNPTEQFSSKIKSSSGTIKRNNPSYKPDFDQS